MNSYHSHLLPTIWMKINSALKLEYFLIYNIVFLIILCPYVLYPSKWLGGNIRQPVSPPYGHVYIVHMWVEFSVISQYVDIKLLCHLIWSSVCTISIAAIIEIGKTSSSSGGGTILLLLLFVENCGRMRVVAISIIIYFDESPFCYVGGKKDIIVLVVFFFVVAFCLAEAKYPCFNFEEWGSNMCREQASERPIKNQFI